jgi:hypothetical protein
LLQWFLTRRLLPISDGENCKFLFDGYENIAISTAVESTEIVKKRQKPAT